MIWGLACSGGNKASEGMRGRENETMREVVKGGCEYEGRGRVLEDAKEGYTRIRNGNSSKS